MKVGSINIRGLGAVIKTRKIRELVKVEGLEFLGIQETKVGVVDSFLCTQLWGSSECNWSFYPTRGRSGGLLSIWDSNTLTSIFSFFGPGFIGICFERGVTRVKCFIINVYSPCDLAGKRVLWAELIKVKERFGDGLWCLLGDFNTVTTNRERKGLGNGTGNQEMLEFKTCVNTLELVDPPLLGRKFTWYKADGSAMSRLDRILMSEEWVQKWGVVAQ